MSESSAGQTGLLSVIVVPFASVDAMRRCLDALAAQREPGPLEIIVPVDDETIIWQTLSGHTVKPRMVRARGRAGPAARRAHGVRESRGTLVAITEDHCVPDAGWCAAMRDAHAAPHAAIGGAVDKYEPDGQLGWALFLCDYGRYMSPVAEGPATYLTDCNVSYKRAALDAIPDVWRDEFHETAVHDALAARGETLWLAPAIRVREQRSRSLGTALRERFEHGRVYAGTRVARAPLARRATFAAMAPALPVVIAKRALQNGARGGRTMRAVASLPAIMAAGISWSLGEFVGYVTGRGARAR